MSRIKNCGICLIMKLPLLLVVVLVVVVVVVVVIYIVSRKKQPFELSAVFLPNLHQCYSELQQSFFGLSILR